MRICSSRMFSQMPRPNCMSSRWGPGGAACAPAHTMWYIVGARIEPTTTSAGASTIPASPSRICCALRPVAISTLCASSSSRNDPISTACMCSTIGNGGRCPVCTASIFCSESGMKPARTMAMNQAAMNTKIHRSRACARGVPDRVSGFCSLNPRVSASVAMAKSPVCLSPRRHNITETELEWF